MSATVTTADSSDTPDPPDPALASISKLRVSRVPAAWRTLVNTAAHECGCEGDRVRFQRMSTVGDGDCHIWLGSLDSDGYAQFTMRGNTLFGHRVAYVWIGGVLHPELELRNRCGNKSCVSPAHWTPVPVRGLRGQVASGEITIPVVAVDEHDEPYTYLLGSVAAADEAVDGDESKGSR